MCDIQVLLDIGLFRNQRLIDPPQAGAFKALVVNQ
jgi:hypothetical protein